MCFAPSLDRALFERRGISQVLCGTELIYYLREVLESGQFSVLTGIPTIGSNASQGVSQDR